MLTSTIRSRFASHALHPALADLLKYAATARFRRIIGGFSSRRRLTVSCLSAVLALIWLGNAILIVIIRSPLSLESFADTVPALLLAYALWHVLKAAYRKPEQEIEWTPAEAEFLLSRPFHRLELIAYKFASITTSAVFKAACFAILMLPDLRLPMAGFLGAVSGLLFIDLVRMCIEISVFSLSRRSYTWFRWSIWTLAAGFAVSTLVLTLCSAEAIAALRSPGALGLLRQLLLACGEIRETWVMKTLESPFWIFGGLISAQRWDLSTISLIPLAALLVIVAGRLVLMLDIHGRQAVIRREQRAYAAGQNQCASRKAATSRDRLPRIRWWFGIGPLAWRQFQGAVFYRSSLIIALAAPAVLACLPLAVYDDPASAMLNVVGGLAFYSFVLLPAALKFDFRRDVERMVILKSLPLTPLSVVTGQLATPVIIAGTFQTFVLLIATAICSAPISYFLIAMAILWPMNVLIFALDNLIFLLYPHRLNQEGIEVFLRTTLTFTAKGLLFAFALGVTVGWALVASRLARSIAPGLHVGDVRLMFVVGVWVLALSSAWATFRLLIRAYQRFDPSEDVPA